MVLSLEGIKEKEKWAAAGIALPNHDVVGIREKTKECPEWIHFGAGNIFRGYIAGLADTLMEEGELSTGIIAVETFDDEIIDRIYEPFDMLTLSVGLKADGESIKKVTAGIGDAIKVDYDGFEKLKSYAASDSLQMISFTITEKGYACTDISGKVLRWIENDLDAGPEGAATAMGIVVSILLERFKAGGHPIALVSMDNCSQNGRLLKEAVLFIAERWFKRGFVDKAFISYIKDENKVSFPWSMIDKITPRPDVKVAEKLEELGVEGMAPIETDNHTFIAPFVNAEIPQYLVIEDNFPNGRPPLEKAGVYMTDRDTVNKAERMKVMTCLNPLHTALALSGCILGYKKISDEMQDEDLRKLVYMLGDEGMEVVTSPGIIEPEDFIKEVLEERLPNPNLPDTPQRIATDTSQKLSIRFGETIRGYLSKGREDELKIIPFVIASWFRYLMAKDDNGDDMELSHDPLLEMVCSALVGLELGKENNDMSGIKWILTNIELFGNDLMSVDSLGDKVMNYLNSMLKGPGAYRETLHELVG